MTSAQPQPNSPSQPERYCLFGNPVAHSRSPWIHARFAELTGQALDYQTRLAEPEGFAASLHDFIASGGRGCNVTVPFKVEAAALAQHFSARAALAQAANTLLLRADGIHADNTDGAGLVADIEVHAGVALAGRSVLLVGAGGASAGALGPLLAAGPARLCLVNRSHGRAQQLAARHATLAAQHSVVLHTPAIQAIEGGFDIVINASSSSLSGAASPVAASVLHTGTLALDLMYGPAAQGFLNWAQAHGATPRDGLGMLVEQAAESFFLWRGVRPPAAQVLAELRAVIAAEAD